MLLHHLLHLGIVLSDGTHFPSQNSRSLFAAHSFKLSVLEQKSQCVLDRTSLFQAKAVLDLEIGLC